MKRLFLLSVILVSLAGAAERRARNVILFIGDAGGIPTLNAASIHGHNAPAKLFIQNMPHMGLMDTSASDVWVTDSAAAMSAIVTGYKTRNGVLSELPPEGSQEGKAAKTILEFAEERGLATGVITNMEIWDATPAACYAHVRRRSMAGEIFAQILSPRFGDGVDLVIGAGRKKTLEATAKLGLDVVPALKQKGYAVYDAADAFATTDRRAVALSDKDDFDLAKAVSRAISILERSRKGYFLMAECDTHTDHPKAGLDRMLLLDRIIRETAQRVKGDTLIVFAADHSFDFRMRGGRKGDPLFPPAGSTAKPAFRMDDGHTGEEVLVAAQGPGAGRVHGYFANTDLFHIMMAAYGWERPKR
jgi:alkaline phosphatase